MKYLLTLIPLIFFIAFMNPISTQAQTFVQIGTDIDGEAQGDFSGNSTAMSADGNTIAIGAYNNDGNGTDAGHVRVYNWSGTAWIQQGSDIDGEAAGDQSGISVALSTNGNTIAIGAIGNSGYAGHVRVYNWSGTAWTQQGSDINGEAVVDLSGNSVSLSANGNTLAIGAHLNDGNGTNAGHVRVYNWSGTAWTQQGVDIDGEAVGDYSGVSVSLSANGNSLAIGASRNDGNGIWAGHVRVYNWSGTAWTQQGSDIDGEAAGDFSGAAVSLSANGNVLAISGGGNDDNGMDAGHVRVYNWSGTAWTQQGSDIDGEAAGDYGNSVSLSANGNNLAIGARYNDGAGNDAGHVRVYQWSGTSWVQQAIDIDGEAMDDLSGWYVSLTDSMTLAIGAPQNDGNGIDAGNVRVFKYCTNTSSSVTLNACNSYTSPSNNYTWTTSGTYQDTLTNASGCDSVLTINLTINNSSSNSINVSACNSYTSPSNNYTWTTSGTYQDTLTNANGCDSVITINLTINTITNLATTVNGITITSSNNSASYVWLDCNNNYAPILGETNQSFTPTTNGNYAVQLTENGCVDTSACVPITAVGISENSFSDKINIYPNPSNNGKLHISASGSDIIQSIKILDLSGRTIHESTMPAKEYMIRNPNANGIYIVQVTTNNRVIIKKVVFE